MFGNRIGSGRRKHRRATGSPAADLLSNLIFVYDLDENTTTGDRLERIVPASFPLIVTGTAVTGATGVPGLFDYCYVMNDATSFLETAPDIIGAYDTNTSMSFSWWFSLRGTTPSGSGSTYATIDIYGSSGSSKVFRWSMLSRDFLYAHPRILVRDDTGVDIVYSTYGGSEVRFTGGDTAWHHMLMTASAPQDRIRFYVDGVLTDDVSYSGLGGTALKQGISGTTLEVNAFNDGENTGVNQLALWINRELGLAEAQALYNSGAGLDYSSWT